MFVLTGTYAKTTKTYGSARAPMYVWIEVGHAAQNLLLEATALGLGAVPLGGFDPAKMRRALGIPKGEEPFYVIPVGHPAG